MLMYPIPHLVGTNLPGMCDAAETVAANEMSGRITELSSEPEQTDRHAHAARENAAALETAVGDLRHVIIRVVRTSTTEVDRRRVARHPVDLPSRWSVAGGIHEARLADLSATGARLRHARLAEPDARGTISLEGAAMKLPFVGHLVDDRGALRVTFEANEAVEHAHSALPDRSPQRRAA